MTELPDEIAVLFCKPLSFPASASEQSLMVERGEDLDDGLGGHGTIIYMPCCDRLTYATARTLVEHAMKEMARVYRRAIEKGLKLYVNNRLVEAFDPTYAMANARHARFLDIAEKTSRLMFAKKIAVPLREHRSETADIIIRMYRLPIEQWSTQIGRAHV